MPPMPTHAASDPNGPSSGIVGRVQLAETLVNVPLRAAYPDQLRDVPVPGCTSGAGGAGESGGGAGARVRRSGCWSPSQFPGAIGVLHQAVEVSIAGKLGRAVGVRGA